VGRGGVPRGRRPVPTDRGEELVEKPRVNIRRVPAAVIVELAGEHDLSTHGDVERALMEIASGEACIIDLSSATFIDSSILAVLVQATARDGACASTIVVAPQDSAAVRLFDITGATTLVTVCSSLDEALDSVMISE
jgi:anti-anti-sigma factor